MRVVPLTTLPGERVAPTFSPDGEQVAFAWDGEKHDNWDIYVTIVGSSETRRLTTDPADDLRAELVAGRPTDRVSCGVLADQGATTDSRHVSARWVGPEAE